MKQRYSETVSNTRRKAIREKNDCTVVAMSIALRIPYEEAHTLCAASGRKNGKGFSTMEVLAIANKLGYEAVPVKNLVQKTGSRYTPKTIGDRLRNGYYICISRGHAFAVVNGRVEDWTNGRKHAILSAWRIVKKHDNPVTV